MKYRKYGVLPKMKRWVTLDGEKVNFSDQCQIEDFPSTGKYLTCPLIKKLVKNILQKL